VGAEFITRLGAEQAPPSRVLSVMSIANRRAAPAARKALEFTRVDEALVRQATRVIDLLKRRRLTVVTAESCTGGLLAAVLSEAPGAGDWLHGGFITYTAKNKTTVLGVPAELIERDGAVSEAVARAMAEGALARSPADIAIAITGVAGPEPDEQGTPVGRMHFAAARTGIATMHVRREFGDLGRGPGRYAAVAEAMRLIERAAKLG
jgi:nicotinamide-nucleotide amidase